MQTRHRRAGRSPGVGPAAEWTAARLARPQHHTWQAAPATAPGSKIHTLRSCPKTQVSRREEQEVSVYMMLIWGPAPCWGFQEQPLIGSRPPPLMGEEPRLREVPHPPRHHTAGAPAPSPRNPPPPLEGCPLCKTHPFFPTQNTRPHDGADRGFTSLAQLLLPLPRPSGFRLSY